MAHRESHAGSLYLRADHSNYSRAVLNSNWHQAREAEPKDYDLNTAPRRDLCTATYMRIGDNTDGSIPATTYQDLGKDFTLKNEYLEQEVTKHMINADTAHQVALNRDSLKTGPILPLHTPANHWETSYKASYKSEHGETDAQDTVESSADQVDHSPAYKRCVSQFTDTADYRRCGRNTWKDETGLYANSHLKAQVPVYQKTCPIAEGN